MAMSSSDATQSTSSSLIERVKALDGDAWERLVDLYGPLIYYWCRRSNLRAEDAADISQEVFRSVANNIVSYRRDRPSDTFRGWLWTITRNKLRDYLRGKSGRPPATGGSEFQRQLQEVAAEEPLSESSGAVRHLLQRALDQIRGDFSDPTWQAFCMAVLQGRTPPEIAAELGISPNAVRKARVRVLRRLREELGDTY
jgi:RNA polymerase sigma-70 factor (ECF subfamily)